MRRAPALLQLAPLEAAGGLGLAGAALELALLALLLARTPGAIRAARQRRGEGPVAALAAAFASARLPARLAGFLASEIVAVWLGVTGWFRRAPAGGFSMHRRKSWTAIALLLLAVVAIETVALHLLLATWRPLVAWVVTALSIYGALWIAGDLHALRLYPLRVTDDAVIASVGLRWRMVIPRAAITGVLLTDQVPAGALNASVREPTLLLILDRPIVAHRLFGLRRQGDRIALTVDEPERLAALLAPAAPR